MSKTRVEIWMGGRTEPLCKIYDPKRVEISMDGMMARIVDDEDWVFETSTHNVLFVSPPKESKYDGTRTY